MHATAHSPWMHFCIVALLCLLNWNGKTDAECTFVSPDETAAASAGMWVAPCGRRLLAQLLDLPTPWQKRQCTMKLLMKLNK